MLTIKEKKQLILQRKKIASYFVIFFLLLKFPFMSNRPLLTSDTRRRPYSSTTNYASQRLELPTSRGGISHSSSIPNQKHNHHHRHTAISQSNSSKLDTMEGVTLPTILNVLSILMFLRFGFVIGQMGIIGTIGLLLLSYGIDLLTTLSVSAIATNGTVKGGGAYYMLSRSLGVEFGGAIGIIFFIGQVLNSSMNVAGVIEPLMYNFNEKNGVVYNFLPEGYWYQFGYCSIFLFICIIVSLIGSSAVSKAGKYLCIILVISTLTVPISALIVQPFETEFGGFYSGLSWDTFHENLWPHFTKGAAGSRLDVEENFNDLFGIFFPATAGILAGASMSGDLKNPSKSIPRGTLCGLLVTFGCYLLVIISMGASIPRKLLHRDVQVIQTVNLSPIIILAGEMSTSIFSIIVGIVGAAKLLQAIARDEILPGLAIFGRGDSKTDDPKIAILFTWVICQLFLFADLNQIATLITMAFLMTFIVTNLACALLKIGSAPNFRPSFKYFSTNSALAGTIFCFGAMFIVDGVTASLILVTLACLILVIHFVSPPKQWGDVSQSLIYHQVRKYLLKLRQDNVKYWRPQVLLLVDNPRTSWNLITFCNHLKKGGLYVLGHVYVTDKFQSKAREINSIRQNWVKVRDISKIKAFVQMSIAPTINWGVRNIFLGSGLGGMKPNITIVGFYNLSKYKGDVKIPEGIQFESDEIDYFNQVGSDIPTDEEFRNINSEQLKVTEWVSILEDLSLLNSNIAIARGFPRLDFKERSCYDNKGEVKYIDLYPIQMVGTAFGDKGRSMMTNNFDTCTLILQLGAILSTVPAWKKYKLRVIVFVEELEDVEVERRRVKSLLDILRMNAEVLVLCLKSGEFNLYELFSKGSSEKMGFKQKQFIDEVLKEDEWWKEVCMIRQGGSTGGGGSGGNKGVPIVKNTPYFGRDFSKSMSPMGRGRRMTFSKMNQLGMSLGMGLVVNSFQNDMRASIDGYDESEDDDDYSVYGASQSNSEAGSVKSFTLQRMASSSSIRRVPVKSAFTAEKMPESTIQENAERSIGFHEEDDDEEAVLEEEEEDDEEGGNGGWNKSISKVKFGEMPRRCQFLVINEMMQSVSEGGSKTALIFTTLPSPEQGVHLNEAACVEYVVDISLWGQGLPPLVFINAQSVTVTSNL